MGWWVWAIVPAACVIGLVVALALEAYEQWERRKR